MLESSTISVPDFALLVEVEFPRQMLEDLPECCRRSAPAARIL